ncbi:hypothetical protein K1719_037846 [Acacia pycnantha]|nr:hypothetical protein K1719_037846 [Acacia pycnantha]
MPNPKNNRSAQIESHRRGKLLGSKSSSFHGGQSSATAAMSSQLRRPKTVPDLISHRNHAGSPPDGGLPRQPPKLLLHVTFLGSLGPVKVVMTQESKVSDLVAASVRQYLKEGRRPILPITDPSAFDLHYSQFSLESVDRGEKVMELGSRNFLLCPRKAATPDTAEGGSGEGGSMSRTVLGPCSKEAEKVGKQSGFAWLKFLNFLV